MKTKVKTFIVGGAIRDMLLNRPGKDIDYVVVGATPEWMLKSGFSQVGADFPVFLDKAGNEYALARTEQKTGSGYNGFETNFDPSITLEEDLYRRDLTVNTLTVAQDDWKEFCETKNTDLVIDPFNGIQDLQDGILRHVSDAFAEDPVRVLRVARFAARYDFDITVDTIDLMTQLVESGELDSLTPERVYSELEKAVMEDFPIKFFQILSSVGAYDVLFPELATNKPLMVVESLDRSVLLAGDFLDRLMVVCAASSTEDVQALFKRLKAPNTVMKTLKMSCDFVDGVMQVKPDFDQANDFVNLLHKINAWKNPVMFNKMMSVFVIFDNDFINSISFVFLKVFRIGRIASFDMLTSEQQETLEGSEISDAINALRLDLVERMF